MIGTPYHQLTGVGELVDARRQGVYGEATALALPPVVDHTSDSLCMLQTTFQCAVRRECEGVASEKCDALRAATAAMPECPCVPRHSANLGDHPVFTATSDPVEGPCACEQMVSKQRD